MYLFILSQLEDLVTKEKMKRINPSDPAG